MTTEINETELAKRDDKAKAAILRTIQNATEEARDLREQAKALDAYASKIRAAADGERWWELGGVLDKATVESLCEISPTKLLDE